MNFLTTIYRVLSTPAPKPGEVWENRELPDTEAIILSNLQKTVRARLKKPLPDGASLIEDDQSEFVSRWRPKPEPQFNFNRLSFNI